MARNDDVTVVVACFNYGRFVREAVDSALDQEGGSPRVIVVDDGSTDADTAVVLDSLPASVEVVRQENRGAAAARNVGFARAETPYLIALDADDRLVPSALRQLREPLDAESELGFSYGFMRMFGAWNGVLRFPPYDPYKLLYRHMIGLSGLMRRELFEDTGGFDEAFTQFEDWELWVNALAHGWRGRQVDAVTLENRRHGTSKLREDRSRYRAAWRRMREKHARLYDERGRFVAQSDLGPAGRLVYRTFWGPRPMPALVETALHRLLWGRGGAS